MQLLAPRQLHIAGSLRRRAQAIRPFARARQERRLQLGLFSGGAARPLSSECKPTIRTRDENRMIGMKRSPRRDLAALSRGERVEELSVPLFLSLSSAPR